MKNIEKDIKKNRSRIDQEGHGVEAIDYSYGSILRMEVCKGHREEKIEKGSMRRTLRRRDRELSGRTWKTGVLEEENEKNIEEDIEKKRLGIHQEANQEVKIKMGRMRRILIMTSRRGDGEFIVKNI